MIEKIMYQLDINLSNLTYELARNSITPYTTIFGNFFWGIFFGFIGAAIYAAGSGDKRIYLVLTVYLIGIGVIFGILFDLAAIAIFGLLLAFLVTTILYKVFVETSS